MPDSTAFPVWTNPNGVNLESQFIYLICVKDDSGDEYRYVGKARNAKRLKEYPRNISKIRRRKPRGTTQRYRAVHYALAKAQESGWPYEFYPLENVLQADLNTREKELISEKKCNLNGVKTWPIEEYDSIKLIDLLK